MEHGVSWLSFLPGFHELEKSLRHIQAHGLLGQPVVLQHVVAALLVFGLIMMVAAKARMELNSAKDGGLVPERRVSVRNFIEVVLEALYGQMKQILGDDAKRYFPVIASLAFFIFFSNMLGLIPGFLPPTDNWNTTFACSIFVFLYYNYHGIRQNGLGHFAHMANPTGQWWGWFMMPLMLPIEIVSHFARPFSLGVRLSANMIGDHAVLAAFLGLVPFIVPIPFLALGFFVCVIQTFVFVLLSTIYIALSVADSHGDEHHAAATVT
jgi:F-type H+-transporting ATPase subunit a